MNVTVKFVAQARAAAGVSSESVDVPEAATPGSLLKQLAERHGDSMRGLLLDGDGNPHRSVLLAVGDEQVRVDDPRELKAGDVISIMTPISGG